MKGLKMRGKADEALPKNFFDDKSISKKLFRERPQFIFNQFCNL